MIKRLIIKTVDRKTGLFDPLSLFNGRSKIIEKLAKNMNGKKKVIISNSSCRKGNFIFNSFDINPEDDVVERILKSHTEIECNSLLSSCFIPFYDDIYHFIISCYKITSGPGELIFLTNRNGPFLENNIGQVHHFTGESLHHIMSSQQKDYNVFMADGILGFKIIN